MDISTCTTSLISVTSVWIAVIYSTVDSLHICSCRHALVRYQDLYSSSVVSCFSLVFSIFGSLGLQVLNAFGETRSCDSTVCSPHFFLQAPVGWFRWAPLTGLSKLPSRLTCDSLQFHHVPSSHPSIVNGLNVAKCNLVEVKHETLLASGLHH